MEPKPNNGTLRLPLKVVGLHNDEIVVEQPEDPVPPYPSTKKPASSVAVNPTPTSKIQNVATDITSILPIATTPSPTKKPTVSVGVDPVQVEPERPTRPAQPEESEKPEESQQPKEPEDPEKPDDGGPKGNGGWWDHLTQGLDWVADKVTDLIDKVTDVVTNAVGS